MRRACFTGRKAKGQLRLDNSELYNEYGKSIYDGETFQMTIESIPKPKTTQQNRTYWRCIDKVVRRFEDEGIDSSYLYRLPQPTGVPIDKDMLHQFVYAVFPKFTEKGKRIRMSDSKWTSKMESEVIDAFLNYAASQWGITITINER